MKRCISVSIATVLGLVVPACGSESSGEQTPPLTVGVGGESFAEPTTPPTVEVGSAPLLLFDRFNDGAKETLLVPVTGGVERPLIEPRVTNANVQHASWSPDGQFIAYEVLEATGDEPAAAIWIVRADGSDPQLLASCDESCRQYAYPTWSPDGSRLAAVRYAPYPSDGSCCTSAIVELLVERNESGTWTVTGEQVITSFGETDATTSYDSYHEPEWSNDGSRLAYEVEQYGLEAPYPFLGTRVAVVDVATGVMGFITDPEFQAGSPDWRPCDDLLVIATYPLEPFQTSTAPSNLFTIEADGSDLTQVTDASVDGSDRVGRPSWSPDGRMLYATLGRASDGERLDSVELVTVEPETGAVTGSGIPGAGFHEQPTGTSCAD